MLRSLVLVAALIAAAAHPLAAQVSLELRGGAAIGNHAPSAAGLETSPGPSFAAAVEFTPIRWLSLYAGYAGSRFGCDEGFCTDRGVTVTTSGVGGGVRLHPPRLPWLRAGLTRLGTRVDSDSGRDELDAAAAVDLGFGLSVPLRSSVRLLPGAFFRAHLGSEDRTTSIGAEVGLRVSIPPIR